MNNLREIHLKDLNRIFIAHLNINSLRYKSELLFEQVKGMVAVQIISETKLDNSFPAALFKINLVGLSCFYKRRYPFKVTDQ